MSYTDIISTRWVVGQFLAGVTDGLDADQEPEGIPAQGTVTFTASPAYLPVPVADPNPFTVLPQPRIAVFDGAGYLCTPAPGTKDPAYRGMRLETTNDADSSVVDWTWSAVYNITNSARPVPTHSFALPASDLALDLTTVVKVPSSAGLGTEQAEALAATAQAAAAQAALDAEAAAAAAESAAGAAQVTDSNISALITNPGTDTAQATKALVDEAAASKLEAEDAAATYQQISTLGAALAVQATTEGTDTNTAIQGIADTAAAAAAGPKLNADELDTKSAALVNNPDSSWWLKLLVWLKTIFLGKREIVVSVTEFGAKGDWVAGTGTGTDNLAAFNAAYAYAASIVGYAVKLYIPAGAYRLSGEWNIWRSNSPRNDLVIEGADSLSTFLVSDFYGAGKTLVKVTAGTGVRASPTSIRNLQFMSVDRSGAVPVYLDINGWGESRAEHLRFSSSNNTHMRVASAQNVRASDIVSFYGGRHYNYKATDALTFTTTTGGALTASAPIFTAADVGKVFTVLPATEDLRVQYLIQSVTDGMNATVTGLSLLATTGAKGYFEAAAGAITSGSTTFVADAPVFTSADVGRVIIIRGARAGGWGDGNLRATITAYTSATTVTLDTAAGVTVTRAPFTTPAVDFYTTPVAGGASDTNDFKVDLLHIENNYGVGLCTAPNVFVHLDKTKIHGEHDPIDARHSTAAMWLDDFAGTINGELDGLATGDCRVHISNMNDALTFEWLATRRLRGETIFKLAPMTDPKGFVEVKSFVCYKTTTTGDPYTLVSDPNTQPRLVFTGLVNMLGDGLPPRLYVGKDSYFLPGGQFVNGPTTSPGLFASILSGQNGARQLFEDYATRKYSWGNTAGGGTSMTLTDETAALVRWQVTSSGSVLPGVNNTQPLGTIATRWSDVASNQFTVGAAGITTTTGTGSPEGVVTAPIGSTYINTTGTAGTIKYGKKSGTGNTGWVAIW